MKRNSRRQFLIGAGGTLLALPFLPSLLERNVNAQPPPPKPRFIGWTILHGGLRTQNMYPASTMLTDRTTYLPGHDVHHGPLTLSTSGGRASLSPVLSASQSLLTQSLAQKLSVLRGLDIVCCPGHHDGMFGNFALNDNLNQSAYGGARATLDQVMAESNSVYTPDEPILAQSIHSGMTHRQSWSWGHNTPGDRSSGVYPVRSEDDPARLFDRIFRASSGPTPPEGTPPDFIVNRVHESYRRARGSSRIDAADRQRLEDHMTRLDELERTLARARTISCGNATRPPSRELGDRQLGLEYTREYYSLVNDVMVVAFTCGTTRIATHRVFAPFTPDTAIDWHHNVAHFSTEDPAQARLRDSARDFFESAFLDLAAKLDAIEEGDGKTYLDNSLLMWTNECGYETHSQLDIPIVLAGGAAGFVRQGRFIDFRNMNNGAIHRGHSVNSEDGVHPGLLYNQVLSTALHAMGVPREEFEAPGERGFAYPGFGPKGPRGEGLLADGQTNDTAYPSAVRDRAGDPLPVLTAG